MKGCKVKLMEAKILCNRLREEINEYKSKISSDIAESKEDLNNQLANKQDKLISGTNIKTINGTSLLGSGDIVIQGGGDIPIASATQLGGVKVGNGLKIDTQGTLSVDVATNTEIDALFN